MTLGRCLKSVTLEVGNIAKSHISVHEMRNKRGYSKENRQNTANIFQQSDIQNYQFLNNVVYLS